MKDIGNQTLLICWASQPHIVAGRLTDAGVTGDGSYWHDHSPDGGDIVCVGPFMLHALDESMRDAPSVGESIALTPSTSSRSDANDQSSPLAAIATTEGK